MQANFHFSKISSKKKASKIMKNENFSRFYKAGHSETKRAKNQTHKPVEKSGQQALRACCPKGQTKSK